MKGCLSIAGILPFFEKIRCNAPDKTEMTAELLEGLDSSRVVFIGDSAKDIQAARGNRLAVYGAGFGYAHARDSFDRIFSTPRTLTEALLRYE